MAGPTRLKGNSLHLLIGTVELHLQASSVVLDNEEASGDVTTFADAAAGGARQHFFQITALQSLATESFWRYLWENTGEVATYSFAPGGNTVASADLPIFTGSLTVGPKPAIGGAAGATTTHTFDYRLDCTDEPLMDVLP